jgi:hypothetical protein
VAYYVRVLTHSAESVPLSALQAEVDSVKLEEGTEPDWAKLEVRNYEGNRIAYLVKLPVSRPEGAAELVGLQGQVARSDPENARRWLQQYLSRVMTIYSFQLFTDHIDPVDWSLLGRLQNLLKDTLTGLVQADNEGFYNENGDYILWQMYSEAGGSVPAATLDAAGEWVPFQLNLSDPGAVARFKNGELPRRGLFDVFFKK